MLENAVAGRTKGKFQSEKISRIRKVLGPDLQHTRHAEDHLSEVPRLSNVVQSDFLLATGEQIVQEIEDVFDELREKLERQKTVAADDLLNLIGALQKTEHYCIAAWDMACALDHLTELAATVEAIQRALDAGKRKWEGSLTKFAGQRKFG